MAVFYRLRRAVRLRLRSLLKQIFWESAQEKQEAEHGNLETGWIDPARVTMGRHSYGMPRIIVYDERVPTHLTIGAFCSIAAGVRFLLDGDHRHEFVTTSPILEFDEMPPGHGRGKGPINVGHDVWIGHGATILSGVTIGTGAVVGARAVVASDVRPYAIVVGNPAREVRQRFSDEQIEDLLATEWWTWPDERIEAALPLLWSSDVSAVVNCARSS